MADEADDLPLFSWRPQPAEVIVFPMRARVGKIRRVAVFVLCSKPKAATAYWRRTLEDMHRQMERAGIEPERIADEVATFERLVHAEMARRTALM